LRLTQSTIRRMIKSGHPHELMNWDHFVELMRRELSSGFAASSLLRLLLAAILGGLIGMERELKHRPAGLRTNMFICFGAAMFTLLSAGLAGVPSDAARIAAQIIPGIGFIGAGSIIHTRGLTSGITSAATIFVVASIGMAAGGGLYVTAMFATALVLLTLFVVGHMEETFNLKLLVSSYEVTGANVEEIGNEVNRILESQHRLMQNVNTGSTGQHTRMQFDVEGCNRDQKELLRQLKASTVLTGATSLGRVERE
jgi:putative Mg2+ transporter-C (MgtC) family protein